MKNHYINRNEDGEIISESALSQHEGQEKLKGTSKEIVAFLKKQSEPTEADLNEQKIQAEIRQTAIESLKADGELPADFEG